MARDELLDASVVDEDFEAEGLDQQGLVADLAGLRPTSLDDFVGQPELKRHLSIILGAARKRNEAADHLMFAGPPGLGKTTLAHIVATEMQAQIHTTSGPSLERAGDLAAILTKLSPGDVLFIDEIHRLGKQIEEVLYPAMEDFELDIVLGKGPAARSIRLEIPPFTLVRPDYRPASRPFRRGCTTRLLQCRRPANDRHSHCWDSGRRDRRGRCPRDRYPFPWYATYRQPATSASPRCGRDRLRRSHQP
jgi:Holliday junction resolvasome RuvABC ATP-dependent DNA helicase subunit